MGELPAHRHRVCLLFHLVICTLFKANVLSTGSLCVSFCESNAAGCIFIFWNGMSGSSPIISRDSMCAFQWECCVQKHVWNGLVESIKFCLVCMEGMTCKWEVVWSQQLAADWGSRRPIKGMKYDLHLPNVSWNANSQQAWLQPTHTHAHTCTFSSSNSIQPSCLFTHAAERREIGG